MTGVTFTELVGHRETRHGITCADDVITQSKLPTAARVLVIEDIASLAMTCPAHFEGAGHVVDTADRGDVARGLTFSQFRADNSA